MASLPHHIQIAAAVIRQRDRILLVEQQGRADPLPTWSLPGGVVEPGELPTEAMVREIEEETGLNVLNPGRLLYVRSGVDPSSGCSSTVYVFEIQHWQGELRDADPDEKVLRACFLPPEEALEKLEQLPWPMMREPIVAHLRGEVSPGALWLYHYQPGGSAQLVDVVGRDAHRPDG